MVVSSMGPPGAAELGILLVLLTIVGIVVGRWIYRDAKQRESPWAWQWGAGTAMLFVLGLMPGLFAVLAYFILRPHAD